MSEDLSPDAKIAASWDANAESWTCVVRRGGIESRRAGTDEAILRACRSICAELPSPRVLDAGCGEGWLARALSGLGADVLGVDGSAALVARAREAGGAARYDVAEYRRLTQDPAVARGPWDLVVCNFSLFGEHLEPLLAALGARLVPGGVLLVHTVHPWVVAAAAPPYADGWRRETWSQFGDEFPEPMPWYFRTLESWAMLLRAAGFVVGAIREPLDPSTGRPLSLLLECRPAGGRAS